MPELDFEGRDTLYGTHGLHAYAAKCPPQLARYGIRYYSKPGETVVDPMAGSGTTMVESRLLGRHCHGFDIDPIARLIADVKSTPVEDKLIGEAVERVLKNGRENAGAQIHCPDFNNREYWFSEDVAHDLAVLADSITTTRMETAVRNFLWVAFSSVILSKTSVANARDIIHSRHHHWDHPKPPDVLGKFQLKIRTMRRQMREFVNLCRRAPESSVQAELGDARHIAMPDSSVDLIFTSPPYATALDYTRAHFLAVAWMSEPLGCTVQQYVNQAPNYIGSERGRFPGGFQIDDALDAFPETKAVLTSLSGESKNLAKRIQRYFCQMQAALAEMRRVLKAGRRAIVVVCPSHLRKVPIPTHDILVEIARGIGFQLVREHTRTIAERRRLLPYIQKSFGKRMDTEYVIILEKD
jgi:DNA modification methylase